MFLLLRGDEDDNDDDDKEDDELAECVSVFWFRQRSCEPGAWWRELVS